MLIRSGRFLVLNYPIPDFQFSIHVALPSGLIYSSSDVTFCLQHGHVLLRRGYVCSPTEAERFIKQAFIEQKNPLP
jgi:hypothetical protein